MTIRLPWTRLPVVPVPVISTPWARLPEMTLRAPAAVPPTVLLVDLPSIATPSLIFPSGAGPDRAVGLCDGPAEAVGAAVGGVGDGEGREIMAALERLDDEPAAAVEPALATRAVELAAAEQGRKHALGT